MTPWVAIAAAFVGLLGIVALFLGLRGRRIDDHPVCRRCKFDLFGVEIGSPGAKCPECGRDLGRRRALQLGQRRRSDRPLRLGIAALGVAAALSVGLVWTAVSGFNWNTVKPAWMLRLEAHSLAGARADAALAELLRRAESGDLGEDVVADLVREGLRRQSNTERDWPRHWGSFIEFAWDNGALADDVFRGYLRRAVQSMFSLEARDAIRVGDPLPYWIRFHEGRVAADSSLVLVFRWSEIRVEGELVQSLDESATGWTMHQMGSEGLLDLSLENRTDSLEPGRRTVSVLLTGYIARRSAWGVPIMQVTHLLQDVVETHPTDASVVELVSDPALRTAIENAVSAGGLRVETGENGLVAKGMMSFRDLPFPVAFDISWRSGDREWPVGSVAGGRHPWGTGGIAEFGSVIQGFTADRIDLVLRPSRAAARRTVNVHRIWDGEIVIEDIPVQWVTDP